MLSLNFISGVILDFLFWCCPLMLWVVLWCCPLIFFLPLSLIALDFCIWSFLHASSFQCVQFSREVLNCFSVIDLLISWMHPPSFFVLTAQMTTTIHVYKGLAATSHVWSYQHFKTRNRSTRSNNPPHKLPHEDSTETPQTRTLTIRGKPHNNSHIAPANSKLSALLQ